VGSGRREAESGERFALGSLRCAHCEMMRPHFRFEDLEIWRLAVELAVKFHRVAELLDQRKYYRYAEQMRAAGLSVSNNIARPVK
jgi:hypothetical protein